MINLFDVPADSLPFTTRTLVRLARERGWQSLERIPGSTLMLATRPDGKALRLNSSTPPTTNAFASYAADDKLATHALLQQADIPQPATVYLENDQVLQDFLLQHSPIVIKPNDGAHGNGVTTNITDLADAQQAVEKAKQHSRFGQVLAQEQLTATTDELRIICIDYQFVIALARIPAAVTGDGTHTVAELIELENSTIRTVPYQSDLAYIDQESALRYLGDRAQEVPAAGAKFRVLATCNIGRGGTVRDVSAELSLEQKQTAELVARTMELPVAGVDFFGDFVIEVNRTPSLYYPTGDASADLAVRKYLDYLEAL